MPPRNDSSEPPPVMTWKKATWVLVACVVFDLLRIMFEQFWFFGPALAAAYCTVKAGGVVGTTVSGWLCSSAALAAGVVGFAAIETFGIVMAMATGLFGWLSILGLLMLFNRRIFVENAGNMVLFGVSLLVSEVPLVGTVPAISLIVWRMYSTQIQKDKEALARYEQEREAARLEEQRRRALEFAQRQAVHEEREAANDEKYYDDTPDNVVPFPSERTPGGSAGGEKYPLENKKVA